MIDLRLITNEEIAEIMNDQIKAITYDGLTRSGLLGALEAMKEGSKNIPLDSFFIIEARLTRLRRFKEIQESQLKQFMEVLKEY
jgi:hypothetical protein